MNFKEKYFQESPPDIIRKALDIQHPHMQNITFERLAKEGWARLNLPEGSLIEKLEGKFPTPSTKIELSSAVLKDQGLGALPVYHPNPESPEGNSNLYKKYH